MSVVNSDLNTLLQAIKNMQTEIDSIETTKTSILTKYQQIGNGWNDKKYTDLGNVVNDCSKSLNTILKTLLQGEKYITLLVKSLQEYENVNFGGNAPTVPLSRYMTAEEANDRWKSILKETDELIETYRAEMIAHGVFDGALLTKFLAVQRNQMLRYEAEVLNVARRNRFPLNENEIYHYVITGENSPYHYSNLINEFGNFCIQEVNSWVGKINPNPNNDPRRNINCGQCAAAVYQRMNGDTNATAGVGTYSISEMNEITGHTQTTMTPEQIESHLMEQGAGAHVVVGVDRVNGAGNWFNAFYDGRQVYTIEGQVGCVNGWPPDYGDVVHWDASI